MNIDKLTSSILHREVLMEADYGLPEQIVDNFIDQQQDQGGNQQTDNQDTNQGAQDQNTNDQAQAQQNPENEQPDNLDDDNTPDDQQDGTNQNDNQDSDDSYGLDANIDGFDDAQPEGDNDIPKLKILKTLSDKEYKLNNLRCFHQFKELYKNVENAINNNIMNVVTKNARQRKIVATVHNNLTMMLSDLDNYMLFKFGDIYEDNILAYVTYLKRYHVAMKIIRLVVDENIKNENNPISDKK